MRRGIVTFAAVLVILAACGGGDDRPRCSECGMYADEVPGSFAFAKDAAGGGLRFDAPRCLFRFLAGPRGRGATAAEVTEHYSGARVPADSVVFVVGSDVTGPMGRDLIPVDRQHAAQFVADHGGRVVERRAIDLAMLRSLDP